MANIDTDRENRDPGITDESIDDGPGQVNVVHNDTRNTADNRANTASEEKAAGSEHGENNVIAQAEARVWSDRLTALETTIERQNERMDELMALVAAQNPTPTTNSGRPHAVAPPTQAAPPQAPLHQQAAAPANPDNRQERQRGTPSAHAPVFMPAQTPARMQAQQPAPPFPMLSPAARPRAGPGIYLCRPTNTGISA